MTTAYMPSLDGLRFFSFLFVFFYHALAYLKDLGAPDAVIKSLRIFEVGWIGVDVFFVLSGYLITTGLLKTREQPGYFSNFYRKRVLRIWPLYYGVCVLVILVTPGVFYVHGSPLSDPRGVWTLFLTHLQNWWMSVHGNGTPALAHFWSLAVEEQFYLVWPLCVLAMPAGRGGAAVCAAAIGLVCLLRVAVQLYFGPDAADFLHYSTVARFDSLVAGSGLAFLAASDKRLSLLAFAFRFAAPLMFLCVLFLGTVWPSIPFGSRPTQSVGYTVIAGGAVGLVMLFRLPDCDRSFFALRPFRYLGKISYGLYVFHGLALHFIARVFAERGLTGATGAAAFLAVTLGLTIAISVISYHGFERPFLRMKPTKAGTS